MYVVNIVLDRKHGKFYLTHTYAHIHTHTFLFLYDNMLNR